MAHNVYEKLITDIVVSNRIAKGSPYAVMSKNIYKNLEPHILHSGEIFLGLVGTLQELAIYIFVNNRGYVTVM